jgi:hypothetical protein
MMWLLTAWGGVKRIWLYMGKADALATIANRDATIAQMEQASKKAEKLALDNANRVKDEYERISDNAKKDYALNLADNRAAIERWKLQNRRGATGKTDSATATEVPTGITGAETVPVIPRGFVLLPESDLDKTADIQATLAALQEAARKVMAVETVQSVPDTPQSTRETRAQ